MDAHHRGKPEDIWSTSRTAHNLVWDIFSFTDKDTVGQLPSWWRRLTCSAHTHLHQHMISRRQSFFTLIPCFVDLTRFPPLGHERQGPISLAAAALRTGVVRAYFVDALRGVWETSITGRSPCGDFGSEMPHDGGTFFFFFGSSGFSLPHFLSLILGAGLGFPSFHSAWRVDRTFTMVDDELWGMPSHVLRTTDTPRQQLEGRVSRRTCSTMPYKTFRGYGATRQRISRGNVICLVQRLAIDV